MRVKMLFVLLFCALQGAYGSKSKNKSGKFRKLVKYCLIIFAVNEVSNRRNRRASDSNALACKYNVPDQNAMVIMKFAVCAKKPNFEKYLIDNSENCSKFKKVYDKAKIVAKCLSKVPAIIFKGVSAKLSGKQLSSKTNVEMMKAYLNPVLGPEVSLIYESKILQQLREKKDKKYFQFFRFAHTLELTKEVYPGNISEKSGAALMLTLDKLYHGDATLKHVKDMLELTRVKNSNNERAAVLEAFYIRYKDINVDHAKRLFELTQLLAEDKPVAVEFAMQSEYEDVDVDNAKSLLELAKLSMLTSENSSQRLWVNEHYRRGGEKLSPKVSEAVLKAAVFSTLTTYKDVKANHAKSLFKLKKLLYPGNIALAAKEALEPKYNNIDVDKVYKTYQALKKSGPQKLSEKEIMKKAFKVIYPEILKEDF